MILKTHKDVYKNVAEKLELPYDMVELVGNFTWDELGKSLDNFENRLTYFYGLGAFRFRKKKSLDYLKRVENIKEKMIKMKRPLEYAELAEKRVTEKTDKMKVLIKAWDDWMIRKAEFKIRKEKYYVDRNIQEQSSNLEGLKNRTFKKEHIEAIYEERIKTCRDCELYDTTGNGCHVIGTQPCCNLNLGGCGCSLSLKLRVLSENCPKEKWKAVVNKQEEEMINQQILNDKLGGTKN